jgi:hypothetical protein
MICCSVICHFDFTKVQFFVNVKAFWSVFVNISKNQNGQSFF